MKEEDDNENGEEDLKEQTKKKGYFYKYTNDVIVLSGWFYYLFQLFRAEQNIDNTLILMLLVAVFGSKVYKSVKGE